MNAHDESRPERQRRQGGWVSTVLALSLLVVVGFLCGALAGFLWEEPRLVIAYLSGETQQVQWSEGSEPLAASETDEPEAGAEVAARDEAPARAEPAAPAPVAAARPAPAPAPAAKPAPKPTPPVAAAPPGRFAVQVGAFGERSAAEALAKRLSDKGYSSYVAPADGSWRVRVGPVKERSGAEALAAKLERAEKLPTWVLDEDAS